VTGLRRLAILLAVTTGLTLGLTGPASASYLSTVTAPPVTVTTATVLPPTAISTAGTVCRGNTLDLHLTWGPSPSPRVTGYRVRMYTNVGINWVLGTTSTSQTSYDAAVSVRVNGQPTSYQFTLTTLTDYTWTTESSRTGVITC
jgi:hypothetical protein